MTQTERLNTALAGRYRIERHLGEGGMAAVYLAEDLKHDRKVALKILKPELAAVLGAERFVQEIKTTAALQHPHILPLFDSGTADGFLYYVMPFVQGETLRAKLNRETQLGVDEAVRIASEVLEALDYAHRQGVIHRDIKPENILLHDGRPVVADFGIALAVSAAAGGRMTETGLSLGTPHYMSPEQATADKEITGRSDVYSLASVLYEMLAGQPPHLGGSAQQIIMKIIAEPVETVTRYRKAVPPHVAAALARALEKLPADRFETAKAFREALGNATFAHAATAATPGTEARIRVVSWALVAAVTVAVIATLAAVWGWSRRGPRPDVARFAIALPDSQALVQITFQRLALSPDGRVLVYVGQGDAPGTVRLWRRQIDQLSGAPIAGTDGASNPSFSPDGRRLAFISGTPRTLRTIALDGGAPVVLTDSLVDNGGVSWGEDGYIYYDGHLEGDGLARIRAGGGSSPEIATRPDTSESWHAVPSTLPGGRGVLFSVARNRGFSFDIGVLDAKTGRHKLVVNAATAGQYAFGHLVYVTLDGALTAVPFDLDRLEVTGEAFAIGDRVGVRGLSRVDLSISARGHLAYTTGTAAGGTMELTWVARDGTPTPIDPDWTRRIASRPVLSPDGRRAAVVVLGSNNAPQIWIKQLDRGPAARIADQGSWPSWSPDGRDIVFRGAGGTLARGPADGSRLPRVFARSRGPGGAELSPDGTWIVYTQLGNVFFSRLEGDTTPVALLDHPRAVEQHATVSPDGRYVAYMSDESGVPEVYVRPFPDAASAKWSVSVAGGAWPRWSPNGRELFFLDADQNFYAVPVTLSPTFSAGTPRVLIAGSRLASFLAPFDVSRDGSRFIMARRSGDDRDLESYIVLVQNFMEELRARQ